MSLSPLKIAQKRDSGQDTSGVSDNQKLSAADINAMVQAINQLREQHGAPVMDYSKRLTIKNNNDGQSQITNVGDFELGIFEFTNGVKRIGIMQLAGSGDRAVEGTWKNIFTTIIE